METELTQERKSAATHGITIAASTDWDSLFPIIKELRPMLTPESFRSLVREAAARDQYEMHAAYEGESCVAVMGFRILFDLVHGKHLYVDDLVVTASYRSRGIGALLLQHAELVAAQLGCTGLRLSTGVENADGIKFYQKEGWQSRAIVFKKKL